ncbi:MAG TPA: sigma-70 family RNA polymerase sigma factor [Ktedonobacteraceae bacterium]|jgi:RNA polymerase sigma-70 factor, ECF subfamily|nr:sigma-70 family RNA polymerase sigma factor [Ktedonobacteraceae bacterium]
MVTSTDTITDAELVARCKRELPGNTRSYELLVERHMNRVYSIVYRIVCNKEEAEDITQEVFVKVYHGLKKFEQQASFSSWVYRIATNSALDSLDKIKRQQKHTVSPSNTVSNAKDEEKDPLHLHASAEAGPEESSIQRELRECISQILRRMDRQQARLLILRDFDDVSYDEIAALLKVGLSAVKMRIHRARLAFQELFSQTCGRDYLFSVASNTSSSPKGSRPKKG